MLYPTPMRGRLRHPSVTLAVIQPPAQWIPGASLGSVPVTDLADRHADTDLEFDAYRAELTGYCYRMLGSPFEAEDAVQETHLRAWRNRHRFDPDRGAWKTWLYAIATNVCLDMLRGAKRRARAMDMGPASEGGGPDFGRPLSEDHWVLPVADQQVLSGGQDPAAVVEVRESVRLAFIAALQWLPPRQRSILVLRDVLNWSAQEVAQLLDTSPTAVNSALQRARMTIDDRLPEPSTEAFDPSDDRQRELLEEYVSAFESHDIPRLVSLLREDAINSMPPFPWWVRGRDVIGRLFDTGDGCRGDRLVPTIANGAPAFGQYKQVDGRHRPFGLVVLGVVDGQIVESTTFLGVERLFPCFGLPSALGESERT